MNKILIFNSTSNKIKIIDNNIPINIKLNNDYDNIQNTYEYKFNNIYKYESGKDIQLVYSNTDINNINYIINIIEDIYTNYNKNEQLFTNLLKNNNSHNVQVTNIQPTNFKVKLYYALFLLYMLFKLYYTFKNCNWLHI
jgi:hypothetical protein